jgi:hypothetical protein
VLQQDDHQQFQLAKTRKTNETKACYATEFRNEKGLLLPACMRASAFDI